MDITRDEEMIAECIRCGIKITNIEYRGDGNVVCTVKAPVKRNKRINELIDFIINFTKNALSDRLKEELDYMNLHK